MQYRKLGRTDINVSTLCLGTMTYGQQNTEADAHAQLDYAIERGINFIDTAELYPVPPQKETQGRTESYIGSWLAARKCRDKVILATKAAGPADWVPYIRNGPQLNLDHMQRALDASLKRLNTDYVDLYQLHWPERQTNYFGKLGYTPKSDNNAIPPEETLRALETLVKSGKVRTIGISNETAWGAMHYVQLSEQLDLPRIVSIQNPYNLLNRTFEIGLAEVAHREQVGLLAYSPLGFGVLTGKYLDGARPEKGRLTLWDRFSRYLNKHGQAATKAYVELARRYELNPTQVALAFVNKQPFLTSNIIGATTLEQLQENIDSIDLELPGELIREINLIHVEYPNPCP